MSKVAIVTDSTAYLPEDLVKAYNITVVPLVVIWGEETLFDNVDIGPDEFYKRLSTSKVMPSTSQPTVNAFAEVFEKLHNEGYEILTQVISSKLSGTMDSALQAKKLFPEANIEVIDSQNTSVPLEFMVLSAARAAKNGASLAECKEIAETIRKHSEVFFAVDTLEFLHRGGRIGGASRFLGTALNLKPILQLEEGKIEALERVRTSKRAHSRLIELLESRVNSHTSVNMIGVVSAAAEKSASHLISEIKKRFEPDEILMANLSPVIGTHTGPGTVGVAYVAGVDPELLKNG
ncbi:MAG: DegV family protein [Chloroflexota bacterium]|jgi:DegV family protein with EDD domain|nr:DegV family protein [Chloroflexota bacterium]